MFWLPLACFSSATTCAVFSLLRPMMVTVAPRLANSFAAALPIPSVAPVTRNTRPIRSLVMSSALRRFSIRNSEAQIRTIDKPPQLVPNVERMIVARIEKLEEAARDPSGERVRVEAQDLIGTVTLIEEGEHII